MPLHDVGYRAWHGRLRPPLAAAGVIALTGVRLAWKSLWLRRMILFAWSPTLVFAASFFMFEQAIDEQRLGSLAHGARVGRNVDGMGILGTVIADALGGAPPRPGTEHAAQIVSTRRLVWTRLLLVFMRAPQALLLAAVIGLVAPQLISGDLRAKAWLIYFTRPVGRMEYILGKIGTLTVIVALITVLPAMVLWLTGVLVSPSLTVAAQTWDLPLRAIGASAVLAVPTLLLALACSSLTAETRIAGFGWFAIWCGCSIAHSALTAADLSRAPAAAAATAATDPDESAEHERRVNWIARAAGLDGTLDRWAWVSPYHAVGVVQAAIFGIERRPQAVLPPATALVVVSLVSVAVLAWRVDSPLRV